MSRLVYNSVEIHPAGDPDPSVPSKLERGCPRSLAFGDRGWKRCRTFLISATKSAPAGIAAPVPVGSAPELSHKRTRPQRSCPDGGTYPCGLNVPGSALRLSKDQSHSHESPRKTPHDQGRLGIFALSPITSPKSLLRDLQPVVRFVVSLTF